MGKRLTPFLDSVAPAEALAPIASEMHHFFHAKYPCVAGLRAYHKGEYLVGVYGRLGQGSTWRALRQDLEFYISEQKKTGSTFLTFFAVFAPETFTENEFETALWSELSLLTSEEERSLDWTDPAAQDPQLPNFKLSVCGSDFFVVGLHQASSRVARRFKYPALVFNLFCQFKQLQDQGVYAPMVDLIRKRDQALQGQPNPMAVQHGEKWEAIQFSGKENPPTWKCPFHFLHASEKPH